MPKQLPLIDGFKPPPKPEHCKIKHKDWDDRGGCHRNFVCRDDRGDCIYLNQALYIDIRGYKQFNSETF